MKIIRNTVPISDLYNQMKSGELVINRNYQRSPGLWPNNARVYFIDTILNDFPFPKVVIRQIVDLKTKKTKREIIDGQQRLTIIKDFIDNKIKLTSISKKFSGLKFEDLDEDIQKAFLAYEVSVDNVIAATEEEILEIFRRINSYTLPLNTAEKRHATFQGRFKWFVNELTEYFTPFFEKFQILSIREISRMMDADLITECIQIYDEGIQNRNTKKLDNLYKKYDKKFEKEEEYRSIMIETFDFIKDNLVEIFDVSEVKAYNFYSLFGALLFNKYGIPDPKKDLSDYQPLGKFVNDINKASELIIRMLTEANEKNDKGDFPEFVKASIATTHSYKNRIIRLKYFIQALQA